MYKFDPIQGRLVLRGPKGPSGSGVGGTDSSYTHIQSVPASTWTINHNLGYQPTISLMTTGGLVFEADIQHTSMNQATVILTTNQAGIARCN